MHINHILRHMLRSPHRHLVVGPLFVLVFLKSMLLAVAPVSPEQIAEQGISHANGIVAGNGIVEWEKDGVRLRGVDGAFHVIASTRSIAVSALTTPVLARSQTGIVLVPMGMQYAFDRFPSPQGRGVDNISHLLPLPEHFLREQLLKVQEMHEEFSLPQLSLDQILRDEDTWLIASLHPRLARTAWASPVPENIGHDVAMLRLALLPVSDHQSEALPTTIVTLWGRDLLQMLRTSPAPERDLRTLLPLFIQDIAALDDASLPDRANRYRMVLRDAVAPFASVVPKRLLAALEAPAPSKLTASTLPVTVPPPSANRAGTRQMLPETEVVARAKSALSAAGALFTVDASLHLASGTAVEIDGALFPLAKGYRSMSFTYDTATGLVDHILLGGKTLPYALPLDRFVEWVKRG